MRCYIACPAPIQTTRLRRDCMRSRASRPDVSWFRTIEQVLLLSDRKGPIWLEIGHLQQADKAVAAHIEDDAPIDPFMLWLGLENSEIEVHPSPHRAHVTRTRRDGLCRSGTCGRARARGARGTSFRSGRRAAQPTGEHLLGITAYNTALLSRAAIARRANPTQAPPLAAVPLSTVIGCPSAMRGARCSLPCRATAN